MRAIYSNRGTIAVLAAVFTALQLTPHISHGASPQHPVVPGFDRIYSADNANAVEGGQLLLTELNCVSCHKVDDETSKRLKPKQAPILDTVGARTEVKWLKGYLSSVHDAKAGTTMPDLLAGLAPATRMQQITALTHFSRRPAASLTQWVTLQPSCVANGYSTQSGALPAMLRFETVSKLHQIPFHSERSPTSTH